MPPILHGDLVCLSIFGGGVVTYVCLVSFYIFNGVVETESLITFQLHLYIFLSLGIICILRKKNVRFFKLFPSTWKGREAASAHHVIMPNNPDPIHISVNLSPQQFIVTTVNIPTTIDAPNFADLVGEFFQVLELEFLIKSSKKILQLATFSQQNDETLKMLYRKLLKLKQDTQSITNLEAAHRYLHSLEITSTLHAQVF
jgi:hypothetical protein